MRLKETNRLSLAVGSAILPYCATIRDSPTVIEMLPDLYRMIVCVSPAFPY